MYNFTTILNLLKTKKQHLIIKEEIDTIYYLVKKPKNQNFENFYKFDLAADEVKKIKDDFFYCTRFLANNNTENFYIKKIEINENEFLDFIKNKVKDLNELNVVLRELEENEIYLIIADKFFDPTKQSLDDSTLFPFNLF